MDELNKEYIILFNGITDTIQQLEGTINRLKVLQKKAEEAYLVAFDQACEPQEAPAQQGETDAKNEQPH